MNFDLMDYATESIDCYRCAQCLASPKDYARICPSIEYYKFWAYSGGGRIAVLKSLALGTIDWSEDVAQVLYTCSLCAGCVEACPTSWGRFLNPKEMNWTNLVEMIRLMREECVKRGLDPTMIRRLMTTSQESHNVFLDSHEVRFKWLPEGTPIHTGSSTAYYVGCTTAYRQPEIALATMRLLERADIDYTLLGPEEWCCGTPQIDFGYPDDARSLAEHNVQSLKDLGIKRIIFNCPGCYKAFKQDYPKLIGEQPFELIHTTELLPQLIKDKRLKLTRPIQQTVTYHDSCHLGRFLGIYEQPREVIHNIPGVNFIELNQNRQWTWCCGGTAKAAYYNFQLWASKERINHVDEVGAETLLSACPYCKLNFVDAIRRSSSEVKCLDLTELVVAALD